MALEPRVLFVIFSFLCCVFSGFWSLLTAGNISEPMAKPEVGSRKGLLDTEGFLTGDPGTPTFGVQKMFALVNNA